MTVHLNTAECQPAPPLLPQFPWGFQPPKGFKLPHYVPRTPASVPTPKQLGYTMPGELTLVAQAAGGRCHRPCSAVHLAHLPCALLLP